MRLKIWICTCFLRLKSVPDPDGQRDLDLALTHPRHPSFSQNAAWCLERLQKGKRYEDAGKLADAMRCYDHAASINPKCVWNVYWLKKMEHIQINAD